MSETIETVGRHSVAFQRSLSGENLIDSAAARQLLLIVKNVKFRSHDTDYLPTHSRQLGQPYMYDVIYLVERWWYANYSSHSPWKWRAIDNPAKVTNLRYRARERARARFTRRRREVVTLCLPD